MMKRFLILFLAIGFAWNLSAQETKTEEGYVFTDTKEIKGTSVKDQSRSGTCWSFSGIGFLEDELLRLGKGEYDLSEMWIVRNAYHDKAVKYVRLHGELTFAGGGATEDIPNTIRKYGIVPDEVYPGLNYGTKNHNHGELDTVLA
jgi:bleomycin hydrolase